MSYKFEKAIVYHDEKRFLELSAEVFKIAFDIPKEKFHEIMGHDLISTCSHTMDETDFVYFITDEIALTVEHAEDEYIRYALYISTEGYEDDYDDYKWYLVSYVENYDSTSQINFQNDKIRYNKNDNCIEYLCSYSEKQDFTVGYPFTKDVYFNYMMNSNLQVIEYEVLNDILELEFPEGFHGNFYDY